MKRNLTLVFVLSFGIFPASLITANAAETILNAQDAVLQANTNYEKGNYADAVDLYERAVQVGIDNGHIQFNLGNAYYRLGKLGEAITAYRKALLELPADPDLQSNLRLARSQVVDKIGENDSAQDLLSSTLLVANRHFSIAELSVALAWASALLCALIVGNGMRPDIIGIKSISTITLLCLYMALITYGTHANRAGVPSLALFSSGEPLASGVIVLPEAKVYSGNAESYQVIFVLHDGTEVATGERREGWQEIALPDGKRGWVKVESITTI